MMKDKYGTDVRVLPAGNDVARLAPLRAARGHVRDGLRQLFRSGRRVRIRHQGMGSASPAIGAFYRRLQRASLGVAKDTGVTEIKQLKGKRVGFVVGSPALNQNALAVLAFGDLKQSDVKIVEFSSYGAMWKGMVNNDVDAAFATTITGPAKELETSPRGIVWPPLPPGDKAGWERVKRLARSSSRTSRPAVPASPRTSRSSSATTPTRSSCPTALAADEVYAITKAMITATTPTRTRRARVALRPTARPRTGWSRCIRAREGAQGSRAVDRRAGAHNNGLLKRQQVLAAAWADYGKSSPPSDDKAFLDGWMKARRR